MAGSLNKMIVEEEFHFKIRSAPQTYFDRIFFYHYEASIGKSYPK